MLTRDLCDFLFRMLRGMGHKLFLEAKKSFLHETFVRREKKMLASDLDLQEADTNDALSGEFISYLPPALACAR